MVVSEFSGTSAAPELDQPIGVCEYDVTREVLARVAVPFGDYVRVRDEVRESGVRIHLADLLLVKLVERRWEPLHTFFVRVPEHVEELGRRSITMRRRHRDAGTWHHLILIRGGRHGGDDDPTVAPKTLPSFPKEKTVRHHVVFNRQP